MGDQDITPTPGHSLLPTFAGANQLVERDFLAWEHEGNRAVRQGRWKLVALEGGPWELYDLETDRVESHDLAAANPEIVAKTGEALRHPGPRKWECRRARISTTPSRTTKRKSAA